MKKKIMILLLLVITSFCLSSSVYAEDKKEDNNKTEESAGERKNPCSTYGKDTDDYYACVADRKSALTTSNFVTSGLYSMNPEVKGKEIVQQPDYIKNFSNSAQTSLVYGISIWDPDTIPMNIIGLLISFIEGIGSAFTLIVMILFNVSSTSFWQETIRGVFDTIDNLIFNWSDMNSIFMKVVLLAALFAIAQKLFKNFKKVFGIKDVVQIVFSTIVSVALVIGVARFGKPIMDGIESNVTAFTASTIGQVQKGISGNEEDYEIATKTAIFESLQAQSFRLRHFGVANTNQIKGEDKEERYKNMLNDPSRENAKKERNVYKSTDIIYNSAQACAVLSLSLIFFVHRLLLGIVIGAGCFLVLAISILKEVLMCVSIYALVKCIIAPEKKPALMWFFNRFQWMLLAEGSKLVLSLLIFMMTELLAAISAAKYGLLMILPVDLLIVFIMIYLIKNAPRMLQKVLTMMDADGVGAIHAVGNFVAGHESPKEMWNKAKNHFNSDESDDDLDADEDTNLEKTSKSNLSNIRDENLDDKTEVDKDEKEESSDKDVDEQNAKEDSDAEFDVNKEFDDAMKENDQESDASDKDEKETSENSSIDLVDDLSNEEEDENKSKIKQLEQDNGKENFEDTLEKENEATTSDNVLTKKDSHSKMHETTELEHLESEEKKEISEFDEALNASEQNELDAFYQDLLKDDKNDEMV